MSFIHFLEGVAIELGTIGKATSIEGMLVAICDYNSFWNTLAALYRMKFNRQF
jgi:hypothetical protein